MAGFNGGGMPLIFLASKGIAKMLQGDDDVRFQDTGIPAIFETTLERLDKARTKKVDLYAIGR
jgi:hypothetical protein